MQEIKYSKSIKSQEIFPSKNKQASPLFHALFLQVRCRVEPRKAIQFADHVVIEKPRSAISDISGEVSLMAADSSNKFEGNSHDERFFVKGSIFSFSGSTQRQLWTIGSPPHGSNQTSRNRRKEYRSVVLHVVFSEESGSGVQP